LLVNCWLPSVDSCEVFEELGLSSSIRSTYSLSDTMVLSDEGFWYGLCWVVMLGIVIAF